MSKKAVKEQDEDTDSPPEFVIGFLFDETHEHVLLIKKRRPEMMAGLLNGVGGKRKKREDIEKAMRREFVEETGIRVNKWRQFAIIQVTHQMIVDDPKALVYAFTATLNGERLEPAQITDETPDWYRVTDLLRHPMVHDLPWLVHMAHDKNVRFAHLTY